MTFPFLTFEAALSRRGRATRFIVFALLGAALGFVLNLVATQWRQRGWLALIARLTLFTIVVVALARSYGPAAGLIALVASVVTRGFLVRSRAQHVR